MAPPRAWMHGDAWTHGRMASRRQCWLAARAAAYPEKKVLCVTVTVEKSAQSRTCRSLSPLLLLPLLLLPPMARSRVCGSQGTVPWRRTKPATGRAQQADNKPLAQQTGNNRTVTWWVVRLPKPDAGREVIGVGCGVRCARRAETGQLSVPAN